MFIAVAPRPSPRWQHHRNLAMIVASDDGPPAAASDKEPLHSLGAMGRIGRGGRAGGPGKRIARPSQLPEVDGKIADTAWGCAGCATFNPAPCLVLTSSRHRMVTDL
jgi:hypothetical protein